MTASAPSGVMKHAAKRPSDAKQQIIGQMPVDPVHSDVMSNGLGKTATRSKAGSPGVLTFPGPHYKPSAGGRNVTFSVLKTLVKLASACGLGAWDGVSRAPQGS
ncbi:hypothetical protein M407DRAFT_35177 [Tulasnella calospora MUT 4182]|uniref:Uncharacterized protein n=1 Tax=Tulasnella calospora MUT 4182 TaxID=1051891 RepID=A0A0C3K1J5_9AGAM|nr:hypothetical protein M407DRAFT_35177 [Tulasnella calospora MUT 4182]